MKTLAEAIVAYHLPTETELHEEHGQIKVEEDSDILIDLIKELRDKVGKYTALLESLMQPDSDTVDLLESSQFSKQEQETIYKLFIELTAKIREYYLVHLTYNTQANATYYKELFSLWRAKKEQVKLIVQKALQAWKKDQTLKEAQQSYFG